jgi:hypothetical protein
MAIIAIQPFVAIMFIMTEADPDRRCHLTGARISARHMTQPTRGNIPAFRFCLWAMALETGNMGIGAGRNAHCDSTSRGSMTAGAINLPGMLCMVEAHAEAA